MAKRTIKDITKDLTPKEIEAATAVFENDLIAKGKRKSYEVLAGDLGIGVRTLYEWRQKEPFIEYMHALSVKFEASARTKVMNAIIEGAEEGNAAMAKLYLQTMGMLTNMSVTYIDDGTSATVDKDEVARKLEALRERF